MTWARKRQGWSSSRWRLSLVFLAIFLPNEWYTGEFRNNTAVFLDGRLPSVGVGAPCVNHGTLCNARLPSVGWARKSQEYGCLVMQRCSGSAMQRYAVNVLVRQGGRVRAPQTLLTIHTQATMTLHLHRPSLAGYQVSRPAELPRSGILPRAHLNPLSDADADTWL